MTKEIKLSNFINKSIKNHGEKYDYSLVNYINAKTKVTIICPKHGKFEQTPDTHSRGIGCPECGGSKKSTNNSFILKSKKTHGEKYDYTLVNYINNKTKVKILCPTHGVFEQKPSEHLKYGCWDCGVLTRSLKKTLSFDEFIEKANQRHNYYFDYSKVDYKGYKNKVIIVCPKHGDFIQTVNSHLNGCGCPHCKNSRGESKIEKWLKKQKINYLTQHKFTNCRDIRPLPFDFYLPDYNICIEYDGIHHYEPDRFNGKSNIHDIIKKDNIKNVFCLKNDITLIRIKYTDFNLIPNILSECIFMG